MAGFIRHVLALSRKNFVNWRRTWKGSLLEIIFPLICMYLVTLPYNLADPINRDLQEYLDLAYAQYPVTNPVGIRWIPTKHQPTEMLEFLDFANITDSPEDFYRRNPGFFWPEHCYGYGSNNTNLTALYPEDSEDSTLPPRRNFTAVGYIANNNQIEKDVIA